MSDETGMMPKRIQRKRTRGWRMPPNTIYVGRPTRWGNPFKGENRVGEFHACLLAMQTNKWDMHRPRDFAERAAPHKLDFRLMADSLEALRGKDLACWCSLDQMCHGDVLLELANR